MSNFPYFFVMFIVLYVVFSIGLIVRFYFAVRDSSLPRKARIGICLALALWSQMFLLSRLIEGNSLWSYILTFLGAFWTAFIAHVLFAWLLLVLFQLCNRIFHWLVIAPEDRPRWRHRCCAGIIGAAFLLCFAGWVNSQFLTVREGKIHAPESIAPLRIVAVSDLHLGRMASVDFLAKVVDEIEPLSPDIVFFVGDILEYNLEPADVGALAEALKRLNPRLGLWGVMGNHEYIGDRGELSKQFFKEMGIRVLIDQWAKLEVARENAPAGKILLIGRNDRFVERGSAGQARLTISEIIADVPEEDRDVVKILLDHQPFNLGAAEEAGVFLQLSGHTHNGQLLPFNLVVAMLFENSHGYSRRGQTHYWVSSGVGSWGARIRTTGRPEIVLIDLVPEG